MKSKANQPFMSDLPEVRLQHNIKPFTTTGVDYFGPLYVKKARQTRQSKVLEKCYGAIFTCMSTRCVHIELVGDLTSDKFILALRRFISRRGHVKIIMSDNGTNFVGAKNEIDECLKVIDKKVIYDFATTNKIEWRFNPPLSPWMGGCWESLIKNVKTSLKAIIQSHKLTFEELSTVLCEVELILNNRPLIPISDDSNDFQCLTPNHFLIGEKVKENLNENVYFKDVNFRQNWKKFNH